MRPFLLGSVFFWITFPYSGGYHLDTSGMPLHDTDGITSKRAQLLKIKAKVSSIYMALGLYVDDCVCVIRLDMTIRPWSTEKVMVYYYSIMYAMKFTILT